MTVVLLGASHSAHAQSHDVPTSEESEPGPTADGQEPVLDGLGDAAVAMRRRGIAVMLTGTIAAVGGVVSLMYAAFRMLLSSVCVSPSYTSDAVLVGTCDRESEAPLGWLIGGGAAVFAGLGILRWGFSVKARAYTLDDPSITVSVAPARGGALLGVSGRF